MDVIPHGHTHEKVVGIRYVASHTEEFHEIMKLSMDVATNGNRSIDVRHVPARISVGLPQLCIGHINIPFFQQDLPGLVANLLDLIIISSCPCV